MRFQDWEKFSKQLLLARALIQFGRAVAYFTHERGNLWYTCESCGVSSHPRTFNLWAVDNCGIYFHLNCDKLTVPPIIVAKKKVNQCRV